MGRVGFESPWQALVHHTMVGMISNHHVRIRLHMRDPSWLPTAMGLPQARTASAAAVVKSAQGICYQGDVHLGMDPADTLSASIGRLRQSLASTPRRPQPPTSALSARQRTSQTRFNSKQ
jgi:hypothetical protein